MTEDEAKTKWCPFARTPIAANPNGSFVVGNRDCGEGVLAPWVCCIGSACMAWAEDGTVGQQFYWSKSSFDAAQASMPGVFVAVEGAEQLSGNLKVRRIRATGTCGLVRCPS